MNIDFQQVYDLTIQHTYYRDGVCSDLIPKPTLKTQKLLDSLRIGFKPKQSGFSLFGERGILQEHQAFLEQQTFRFWLTSNNGEFDYFTEPPVESNASDRTPLLFTNVDKQGGLTSGLNVAPVKDDKESASGDNDKSSFARERPFAIVEIRLSISRLIHEIKLLARKTHWVYLIRKPDNRVVIKDYENEIHSRFKKSASPAVYGELVFTELKSPEDDSFVRLRSITPLPFHELPKRNLVLSHPGNAARPDMLLPNPRPRSIKQDNDNQWTAECVVQL